MEWQLRAPNIITNPPFKFVAEFMRKALTLSTGKVALLLRLACLEGNERREIFEATPLARVWVFSRRLQIWRNGDRTSSASGMIPFAWFVWEHGYTARPELGWIAADPAGTYDQEADALGSYNAAIDAIGNSVKAGAPVPESLLSKRAK